jgi:hypothetical protein
MLAIRLVDPIARQVEACYPVVSCSHGCQKSIMKRRKVKCVIECDCKPHGCED